LNTHEAADAVDQVIATRFPAPASYTGDDVVEISAHGSPVVLNTIVMAAMREGARLAEPGEFTLRAFLNGRVDLMQAEAVADLIDAVTPRQARAAFDQLQGTLTQVIGEIDAALFDLIARLEASVDFPEEGYHFIDRAALGSELDGLASRLQRLLSESRRGRLLREGFQVAIVGKPNVGKSSLFNALVGASRAIVTDIPGTTRDLLTEVIDLCGMRVTLVDSAGVRESDDPIEREGVLRSAHAAAVSDLILLVSDGSEELDEADADVAMQLIDTKVLNVLAKADLGMVAELPNAVRVSAKTGYGMEVLARRILAALEIDELADRPAVTNIRHAALIERAHASVSRARAALLDGDGLSEEFVLADLQEARNAVEEITGRRAPEDLLTHIFARFCIGK
jgi:tRNA modification GTPase